MGYLALLSPAAHLSPKPSPQTKYGHWNHICEHNLQRAAKFFFCFAKHHPGSARQKYTQPGKRNLAALCSSIILFNLFALIVLMSLQFNVGFVFVLWDNVPMTMPPLPLLIPVSNRPACGQMSFTLLFWRQVAWEWDRLRLKTQSNMPRLDSKAVFDLSINAVSHLSNELY